MKPDDSKNLNRTEQGRAEFNRLPPTDLSVLTAYKNRDQPDPVEGERLCSLLCGLYLKIAYWAARGQGLKPQDAEDAASNFLFKRLGTPEVLHEYLRKWEPEKQFRWWVVNGAKFEAKTVQKKTKTEEERFRGISLDDVEEQFQREATIGTKSEQDERERDNQIARMAWSGLVRRLACSALESSKLADGLSGVAKETWVKLIADHFMAPRASRAALVSRLNELRQEAELADHSENEVKYLLEGLRKQVKRDALAAHELLDLD
jgi:hypothetical protein